MKLLEELQASVVCGDGAMGTELMGAGVPMEVCLEEVNLTDPDVVRRIHDAYIAGTKLARGARIPPRPRERGIRADDHRCLRLGRVAVGRLRRIDPVPDLVR